MYEYEGGTVVYCTTVETSSGKKRERREEQQFEKLWLPASIQPCLDPLQSGWQAVPLIELAPPESLTSSPINSLD